MPRRILFLNPPAPRPTMRDYACSSTSKGAYVWQPIDFVVQSGHFRGRWDIEPIDASLPGERDAEAVRRKAKAFSPDLIFGLVGTANHPDDFGFLREIHEETGAPVVVSGDVVQFDSAQAFEYGPGVAGVLRDFTSDALLRFGEGDENPGPALFRPGGEPALPKTKGEFAYPVPDHARFARMGYRHPFLGSRFASVLTNYGCPHHCAYCNSGALGFRQRNTDNLLAELDAIRAAGIGRLFVKDMTFNAVPAHAERLLREMAGRRYGFSFVCYVRPGSVDRSFAESLKAAGCRLAMAGIESAARGFAEDNGRESMDAVRRGVDALRASGVRAGGHFLVGLPGETDRSFEDTLTYAKSLKLHYASFNVVTPRPGSGYADRGGTARMDGSHGDARVAGAPDAAAVISRQRRAVRSFYADPRYLLRMALSARPSDLPDLARNAWGLLRGYGLSPRAVKTSAADMSGANGHV